VTPNAALRKLSSIYDGLASSITSSITWPPSPPTVWQRELILARHLPFIISLASYLSLLFKSFRPLVESLVPSWPRKRNSKPRDLEEGVSWGWVGLGWVGLGGGLGVKSASRRRHDWRSRFLPPVDLLVHHPPPTPLPSFIPLLFPQPRRPQLTSAERYFAVGQLKVLKRFSCEVLETRRDVCLSRTGGEHQLVQANGLCNFREF
jgi:hypothetical protein